MNIKNSKIILRLLVFMFGVSVGLNITFLKNKTEPYDLNQDGIVDIKDMLTIQKHIVEEGENEKQTN